MYPAICNFKTKACRFSQKPPVDGDELRWPQRTDVAGVFVDIDDVSRANGHMVVDLAAQLHDVPA